eukprot:514334-Prymnesium_polylepis.2
MRQTCGPPQRLQPPRLEQGGSARKVRRARRDGRLSHDVEGVQRDGRRRAGDRAGAKGERRMRLRRLAPRRRQRVVHEEGAGVVEAEHGMAVSELLVVRCDCSATQTGREATGARALARRFRCFACLASAKSCDANWRRK